ncbi:MAG: [protein-PII] uridylyltransferase [Proteobacteria bacterium]|nr:[protein-PII] uridylyltransferase [Pseudomonadota bacterium]MBU4407323.1 [protein-PII] uridylyltransferase [Pseudomonadota bacterium]MBU4412254.1 [protein-PII] uridylyltransferase [Pseudomonadota bacterium]MCG2824552.1 [protein-PII] uridylyltransferase [Desulfobulbaceae bacterium]
MVDVELRAKRDALEYLWRQGLSGRPLLHRHSQLIDDYLAGLFNNCPEATEGMSLVALGGYGRRELFPYSDIDLLLLHAPGSEDRLGVVTEALFYPLWDAGLEVGHGVRTLDACLADARQDFFFQVALLDARHLAGSAPLFGAMHQAFHRELIAGHRGEFLQNMMQHRNNRHQRYGMHGYQLEPHIKESRGGFRDIQAMLWVSHALFNLQELQAIEEAGLISSQEKEAFGQAWDFLIKIRNRLHYLSGRKNDQMFFEYQEEMARAFKYSDTPGTLGVERFMQDIYRHLHTIATTTDLFFAHVDETLGAPRANPVEQTIEPGITVRQDRLHLTGQTLIEKRPHLLMRLFAQAGKTGLEIHHRSRKIVTANLHLVDDKLRHSKRMAKSFLDVLENARDAEGVLSVMLDTGLLTAYLPEFEQIRALAQHDVYHVFTVDRHLLQTVAELKKLSLHKTPFAGVESPHVLALAALLHDIGKGHHEDHAQRGSELVTGIGKRLGLTEAETACLSFLVEKHLFLSVTALRRDLEDDAFIRQCAEQIQTPERLAMLYLLSIADAKATGPTAWSEWKGALLMEISLKIAHLLERKDATLPDKSQGAGWMLAQVRALMGKAAPADYGILPEEYLLSFPPEEVAHHLKLRAGLKNEQQAIVEAGDHSLFWSVLIMTRDTTGLLAKICGTLALHGLNVVSAQIFTWEDGTAVDVLNVRPAAEQTYAEQDWRALGEDLNLALKNRLGLSHRLVEKFRTAFRAPGQKNVQAAPRVVIDNQASEQYTIIEVFANDRPGLLYDITRTLADFEINIHRARISSDGDQVVDVFYALDSFATKINSPSFQAEISQALLHIAEKETGTKPQW